ncbi:MAG: hypothetical protein ABSA70_14560 [Terriglobia bacterium]
MRNWSTSAWKLGRQICLITWLTSVAITHTFAQAGTWSTKAAMPTARFGAAVAVVNSLVYVVGGCVSPVGNPVAILEVYDPKTDRWASGSPMPEPRCAGAAAVIDGLIYVAGGYSSVGPTGGRPPVHGIGVYDPRTDTWSTKASIPTTRYGLAVAVVDGVLYAVGGLGSGTGSGRAVEAYNPASNTWTTKAPMPTAREGLAAGVVGGILFVTGGTGSPFPTTLDAYDPRSDAWATRGLIPTPRYSPAAGVINGLIYVVGGASGTRQQVEAYDPKTNTWVTENPMPTGRSGLVAGVVDDVLYAVGGETLHSGPFSVNEAFDPFLRITIDIKPDDPDNTINLKSRGTVPVAILGSATFDPTTVDPATVTLAGAPVVTRPNGVPMTSISDVNGDGYLDLLLHFRTQDLQLTRTSTEAVLYGETFSGQRIRGADAVRIVASDRLLRSNPWTEGPSGRRTLSTD